MASDIRINGSPTPVENITTGQTVTLTNFDNTGVASWSWVILSKPADSSATLTGPLTSSASFVADVDGSWLIQLTTNGVDIDTAVARVLTANIGLASPARDEIEEGDASGNEGWALTMRNNLRTIDAEVGALSGNSTDVTLTAIGASPSANGASLSGQALTLQPADATHGGLINTGTQTLAGAKTFSSLVTGSAGATISGLTTLNRAGVPLSVQDTGGSGFSGFAALNNAGSTAAFIGYSNSTTELRYNNILGSTIGFRFNSAAKLILNNGGSSDFTGDVSATGIVGVGKYATGSIPAAAAGNEGFLVYDDTLNIFKYSNGVTWLSFSDGTVGGTGASGRVAFWSGASTLDSSANLTWDGTVFKATGSIDGLVTIAATDTTGSTSALIIKNDSPGSFGTANLSFTRSGNYVGGVVGYETAAFGLVNGTTLTAPTGKNVGFRIGTTAVGQFSSAGDFSVGSGFFVVSPSASTVTATGAVNGVITAASTDTSGNVSTVLIKNDSPGSFGAASLAFNRSGHFLGSIVGFESASFGLVNGITIAAESGYGIGFRQNGGTSAQFSSSGNFEVNGTTFNVDATNHRVGIGKNNPAVPLDVVGAGTLTGLLTAAQLKATAGDGDGIAASVPTNTRISLNGTGSGVHAGFWSDATSTIYFYLNGSSALTAHSSGTPALSCTSDNLFDIGASAQRWKTVYGYTGDFATVTTNTATVVPGTAATTAKVGGMLSTDMSTVGNVGAGEDTLHTYTLPTNSITVTGRGLRWHAAGVFANNANAKTIRAYFGSTALGDAAISIATAARWWFKASIIRTGTSTQRGTIEIMIIDESSNTPYYYHVATGDITETESGTIVMKMTGEAVSNDDIQQMFTTIEYI